MAIFTQKDDIDLKQVFEKAMKSYTPTPRSGAIEGLWEVILSSHVRPYHNLNRIKETLEILPVVTPSIVLISHFFLASQYNVWLPESRKDSADFASAVLKDSLGWADIFAKQVKSLILGTEIILPPKEDSSCFTEKFMNDFRNCRLAVDPEVFIKNSHLLHLEYENIETKDLVRIRKTLFSAMLKRNKLFHFDSFEERHGEKARVNLKNYISYDFFPFEEELEDSFNLNQEPPIEGEYD